MQSVALLVALALATPVDGAPALDTEPATDAPAAQAPPPSARRVWGVALLAGGSAALAASATSAALVEAVTRPDDRGAEVENPELLQSVAFGTMVVAAASVGAMLAGGALIASE